MGVSSAPAPGSLAPGAVFTRPEGGTATTAGLLEGAHGLPLLLAFFKTSCPTCRLTWPYLQRLHAAYGGARFDLVLDPEPRFAASNAYHVESVPHLTLVSPAGLIEEIFSGWDISFQFVY